MIKGKEDFINKVNEGWLDVEDLTMLNTQGYEIVIHNGKVTNVLYRKEG